MSVAEGAGTEPTAPQLECDLVLKGGITSGIVYPRAIARLARDYRFRSIGGTSAGAIAAAAAAAAEYRRQSKNSMAGFEALAKLPSRFDDAGGKTRVIDLFKPQARFSALFRFILAFVGRERTKEGLPAAPGPLSRISTWMLIGRVCTHAMRCFPAWAFLGAALAVLLAWLLGWHVQWSWRIVVLAVFAFAGASAFALWGLWRAILALSAVDSFFGISRGFQAAPAGKPEDESYLTPWMHRLLQEVAGLNEELLTFRHLRDQRIDLRVVTSNLCFASANELPFGKDDEPVFFKPSQWKALFPSAVITHLLQSTPSATKPGILQAARAAGLEPLPNADGLPVVVAVRMSLSFPLLLSAVPLHVYDPHAGEFRACWFSDGGISSNFPLHFFDSPIPSRPTFAINIEEWLKDPGKDDRVRLPEKNTGGPPRPWRRIRSGNEGQVTALADFVLAIFNTMQNWRDNSLLRLPSSRDRVVGVRLGPGEGGLNLKMTRQLIDKLAAYGELAADQLALHFVPGRAAERAKLGIETSWDNHRWIRLLCTLGGLERLVQRFETAWTSVGPHHSRRYRDLLDPAATPQPPSFSSFSDRQRTLALCCLERARDALEQCGFGSLELGANTPPPALHFRLTQEWEAAATGTDVASPPDISGRV